MSGSDGRGGVKSLMVVCVWSAATGRVLACRQMSQNRLDRTVAALRSMGQTGFWITQGVVVVRGASSLLRPQVRGARRFVFVSGSGQIFQISFFFFLGRSRWKFQMGNGLLYQRVFGKLSVTGQSWYYPHATNKTSFTGFFGGSFKKRS